jgi:dihydrofolate reductase
VTDLHFTLTVVTSADGFIARAHDDSPHLWASPEEQALFFADIAAADWAVMGRNTHTLADRPDRRRIVFSTGAGQGLWAREGQLWIDPRALTPVDLPPLVNGHHPLRKGLILGGTRVHDWFLAHDAIDRVHLTIEPVRFGVGLPLFTDHSGPAEIVLENLGFARQSVESLNPRGTLYSVWQRR